MEDEPHYRRILNALLVNPEDLAEAQSVEVESKVLAPILEWNRRLDTAVTSSTAIKMETYSSGLHVIASEDLKSLGLDPLKYRQWNARLFCEGVEKSLYVQKAGSERFQLYFYVPPSGDGEEGMRTYWLLEDDPTVTSPPLRLQTERIASPGPVAVPQVSTGTLTVSRFEKHMYHPMIRPDRGFTRWFWSDVARTQFKNFDFEITTPAGNRPLRLRLYLANIETSRDSLVEVYINGKRVGETPMRGNRNEILDFSVPPDFVRGGKNEISIFYPFRGLTRPADSIYFAGFTIEYTGVLEATQVGRRFSFDPGGDGSIQVLRFASGVLEFPTFMFDVTDPKSLKIYSFSGFDVRGGSAQVTIEAASPRNFEIVSEHRGLKPKQIKLVKHRLGLLNTSDPADYIVISAPELYEGAKALADWRRTQGYRSMCVNAEDIYDAFSYGVKSPVGIKRFLQYAFVYWPPPKVQNLLMVGESSDYLGDPDLKPPVTQSNLLPVDYADMKSREPAGDFGYSLLTPDDPLPDITVGRISANTLDELDGVIAKIKNYETTSHRGDWASRSVFVLDDELDFPPIATGMIAGGIHDGIRAFKVEAKNFAYSNFWRVWQRKRSLGATKAILDALDEGCLTLNYIGHGGPNLLSSERLLHLSDLRNLNNQDRLTIFTAASCNIAWLDYPMPPALASIGELIVRMPQVGAVASFAPTGGAAPTDHQTLLTPFHDAYSQHGLSRVGEMVLFAHLVYAFQGAYGSLSEQYVLVGDPLTQAQLPDHNLDFTCSVDSLPAYQSARISLKGALASPMYGWVSAALQPTDSEAVALTPPLRVEAGKFEGEMEVPPGLAPGSYRLIATFSNPWLRMASTGVKTVRLVEPAFALKIADDASTEGLLQKDHPYHMTILLTNNSDLDLEGVEIEIRRSDSLQPLTTEWVRLAARASKTYRLTLQMDPGLRLVTVLARYSQGDERAPIVREASRLFAVGTGGPEPAPGILEDTMEFDPREPRPGQPYALVVPVYNLSGKPMSMVYAQIYDDNHHPHAEPQPVPTLAPGEKTILRFNIPWPIDTIHSVSLATGVLKQDEKGQLTFDKLKEESLPISRLAGADLRIVPQSVKFDSANFRDGETVFIHAEVENVGKKAASEFAVEAYQNRPWDEYQKIGPFYAGRTVTIPYLGPGKRKSVTLRWDGYSITGKHSIFVVANSDKRVYETDLDNNVGLGMVEIAPLANLVLDSDSFAAESDLIAEGDELPVMLTIRTDGTPSFHKVPVVMDQGNARRGLDVESGSAILPEVPGDKTLTIEVPWKVQRLCNLFEVRINPHADFPEANNLDNSAVFARDYMVRLGELRDLQFRSTDTLSYQPLLDAGRFTNVEIAPDYHLEPTDYSTLPGHDLVFDPSWVVNPQPPSPEGSDPKRDNRWETDKQLLRASPFETPPTIRLRIPVPLEDRTTFYDVYVSVPSVRDYADGYSTTYFQMKV
ncbi:MAG: C25 family cysteine peptidase, partial [bacterium]